MRKTRKVEVLERFVLEHTREVEQPLLPEMRLYLADDMDELWEMEEEELDKAGVPAPFWAFAWAGGQALARYILDRRELVRGARVLDLACGCGVSAVAAALAGAERVVAVDIDPLAAVATRLNAGLNRVDVCVAAADLVGSESSWPQVLLMGDVFYERDLAARCIEWVRMLAGRGCRILVGDPGRAYLPKDDFRRVARYRVDVSRKLEDTQVRNTSVWEPCSQVTQGGDGVDGDA